MRELLLNSFILSKINLQKNRVFFKARFFFPHFLYARLAAFAAGKIERTVREKTILSFSAKFTPAAPRRNFFSGEMPETRALF